MVEHESEYRAGAAPLSDDAATNPSLFSQEPAGHSGRAPSGNRPEVHVQQVGDEVTRLATRFSDELADSIVRPFADALGRAESATVRLVRESGLLDATSRNDVGAREAWNCVRTYRRGVQRELLAPLATQLAELDAGSSATDLFDRLIDGLSEIESRVPEKLVRAEVAGLYDARAGDSPYVGLRKVAARILRRFAGAGKKDGLTQRVFLRTLVRAHAGLMLPAVLRKRAEAGMHEIGLVVARVETELTRLMHELLQAEARLDRAAHHLPSAREAGADTIPGGDTPSYVDDANGESSVEDRPSRRDIAGAKPSEVGGREPDRPDPHRETLDRIRTANGRLVAALESGRDFSIGKWSSGFNGAVILAMEEFRLDVDRSDTFMVRKSLRKGIEADDEDATRERLAQRWTAWHRETVDRLRFVDSLAGLRDDFLQAQASAIDGAFAIGIMPAAEMHRKAAAALRELSEQAESVFQETLDRYGMNVLLAQLEKLRERSAETVEVSVIGFLRNHMPADSLANANDEILARLRAVVERLPEGFTVHPLPDETDDRIDLTDELRAIALRSIALRALEEPFGPALRAATTAIVGHREAMMLDAEEILAVVRFNLGAGLEELEDSRAAGADRAELSRAAAAARELTRNGLARSIEALDVERGKLDPIGEKVVGAYFDTFRDAWMLLHEHARAESQFQKALATARAVVSEQSRSLAQQATDRLTELRVTARKATRLGRRRAEQLVRLGQEAVGAQAQQEEAFHETMEALTGLRRVLEETPLVYRRLFSFHPLSDPDLLEGRVDDKRRLVMHVQSWRRGIRQGVLITGSPSSGLSSFLNVMERTVLKQFAVRRLELTDRIDDDGVLARRLSKLVDETGDDANRAASLESLCEAVLSRPLPTEPVICVVEHLEHLFLRRISGTALIRDFLTAVSRTDSHILWILTISDFGWQLVEKTEPNAAALVARHELAAINRVVLEKLIMKRHSRSGLNLEFLPPNDPSPLLARRLNRARTEAETQAILREVFFDRLHVQCGQNILLALFYWITSVTPDETESAVRVHPISPLKFGFLAGFSLEQALALKALLEHETLTIEEYAAVNDCAIDTVVEIFEALGNALLIEPVEEDARPDRFDFITVERGSRYRIRPLIVHPVVQFLRGRNIVH